MRSHHHTAAAALRWLRGLRNGGRRGACACLGLHGTLEADLGDGGNGHHPLGAIVETLNADLLNGREW